MTRDEEVKAIVAGVCRPYAVGGHGSADDPLFFAATAPVEEVVRYVLSFRDGLPADPAQEEAARDAEVLERELLLEIDTALLADRPWPVDDDVNARRTVAVVKTVARQLALVWRNLAKHEEKLGKAGIS